jgi:Skp family chaperone for outer membrane proteins
MRGQTSGTVIAVILAMLLGYTWAQRPGLHGAEESRTGEFPVALVDLGKVLNQYKVVVERREELQAQFQKVDESAKSLVAAIQQIQEELKRQKPGTPNHQRLTDELRVKAKEFEEFRQQSQQRLQVEEAKVYAGAYERVSREIQQFAETRNIKLVLRFNIDPIEGKSPNQTAALLARMVLYQNALDITDDIVQALN